MTDKHIAVVKNPFSTATTTPKVPDGKVSSSIGARAQAVNQYSQNIGTAPMVFALFPGLTSALWVANMQAGSGSGGVVSYTQSFMDNGYISLGGTPSDSAGAIATAVDMPNRWRQVSLGLRLTLTNNSEDNDGWFEAIRLTPQYDEETFTLSWTTGDLNTANVGLMQNFNGSNEDQWVNHVSFISGKLRDIHKHCFYSQNIDGCNDFNIVNDSYTIKTAAVQVRGQFPTGTTKTEAKFLNSFEENKDLILSQIDKNFDIVLIRIHGTGISDTNSSGTRIMAHVVSNQEHMYEESNKLSKFQTGTVNAPTALANAYAMLKSDPKPSMIRDPNTAPFRRTIRRTPVRRTFRRRYIRRTKSTYSRKRRYTRRRATRRRVIRRRRY